MQILLEFSHYSCGYQVYKDTDTKNNSGYWCRLRRNRFHPCDRFANVNKSIFDKDGIAEILEEDQESLPSKHILIETYYPRTKK